jgi:hypothetical protein
MPLDQDPLDAHSVGADQHLAHARQHPFHLLGLAPKATNG